MALPTLGGVARLTADSETKHGAGQKGDSVTNLRLAFNQSRYNEQSREWETTGTFFVDAAAWGHLAERTAEWVKGDQVYVSGMIRTEQWQAKDGGNRSKPSMRLNAAHRIEKPTQQSGGNYGGNQGDYNQPQQPQPAQPDPFQDGPPQGQGQFGGQGGSWDNQNQGVPF